MELNKLKDEAYRIACDHGWHYIKYSDEHWLMLVLTEISEAVEADRKGRHADKNQYKSLVEYADRERMLSGDILNQYLKEAFQNEIKDSVEDELADVVIRCLDLAGLRNIELPEELKPCGQMIERINQLSFTEWAYNVSGIVSANLLTLNSALVLVLLNVFGLAEVNHIDILWHVKEKMNYNKTREFKHGKNY